MRLEIAAAPSEVTRCNCSICRRYGVLWAYYQRPQVHIAGGATDVYAWDDRSIAFHRCRTCGCVTHWAPVAQAANRMGINARLLEPAILAQARVRRLDGADTERYWTNNAVRVSIDMSFARCAWLNAPQTWRCDNDSLVVVTDATTDFWRETHYDFVRDSGHFFGCETAGDFTMQLRVRADYDALYDQAGVMVRVDERNWVKAGIEKSDGRCMLSSVLTVDRSDWATGHHAGNPADFWLRATVRNGVIRLQVSSDGEIWPLMRLAPFPKAASYLVGPMCCTPERAGLKVEFSSFDVTPPSGKDLHDLS